MSKWIKPDDYVEKKYNYTYKLTLKSDPRYYYYGVHSSNIEPEFDDYEGSGTNVKNLIKENGHKIFNREILNFFETREEALESEERLVTEEVVSDQFCLNRIKGGGTLDTSGMKISEDARKRIRERILGTKRNRESIEKMIRTRRSRGTDKHTEETKEKLSESHKNTIPINLGGVQKVVKLNDVENYLNEGWVTGYTSSRNEKVSASKMGSKNPMFGKHWTDEQKRKMVETKIARGTNFHSKETREKLASLNREKAKDPVFRKKLSLARKGIPSKTKGNKFVKKDNIEKSIKPEEIQKYLNDGWVLGRLNKKKS